MSPTVSTRLALALLAALALSGCTSRHEVPSYSSMTEDDDAFCRQNGVAVGSNDYVACRKNRDVQRSNALTRANRAQRNLGEMMLNHPERPQ